MYPCWASDGAGVPGLDWLSRKAQGLLRRFGKAVSAARAAGRAAPAPAFEQLGVQLINSHMIKSDYVAAAAGVAARPQVPLVITMHGCYEDFSAQSRAAGSDAEVA